MLINRTLDNRYTILERIGGGGMADVYRAHDKLLDRSVAVKVLRSQFTSDDEFVTRFRREAQAAARLSHPNIVNIYDVGCDEDIYYIVMEYISGETLKERIERAGQLPIESSVRIALEIAEALEHAHQNGLVHCDIKPHNILTTKSGRIKVTDFGIARAVTSATMTHTGTIIGSVHYFSPEQAKGAAVGAKSDIYSLGVVMYEMLTGTVPFNGETPISIALKHLQEEPRPLRESNPEVPPLVEAIVLKAMAKEPDQRFEDISEMITDLRLSQNYLRDDHTRRLSREDYPTQVLPRITPPAGEGVEKSPQPAAVKTRSKTWVWALTGLLIVAFVTGAFLAYGKFWSLNEVIVPSVVGKQVESARNVLADKNLRVSVVETFHDKIPVGQVISQNPEAGSTVKEQRTINLIVSKGGEITVVPDVRGLSRRDAELQIKNAGLTIGRIDEQFAANTVADTVINQNPRPPAQVVKATTIDIVISKGPEPKKLALPDFRGSPLSTVGSQLDSLKLKQGKVTEAASDKYPAGTIIDQNPQPFTEVSEGATIDFTVAKGTSGALKRAVVQVTVPDGPQRRVQVYINGVLLQEQTI
ncbi:MAG: prkC [Anaerospora sp.]|nr:prkC [Anaerospora sp.]